MRTEYVELKCDRCHKKTYFIEEYEDNPKGWSCITLGYTRYDLCPECMKVFNKTKKEFFECEKSITGHEPIPCISKGYWFGHKDEEK